MSIHTCASSGLNKRVPISSATAKTSIQSSGDFLGVQNRRLCRVFGLIPMAFEALSLLQKGISSHYHSRSTVATLRCIVRNKGILSCIKNATALRIRSRFRMVLLYTGVHMHINMHSRTHTHSLTHSLTYTHTHASNERHLNCIQIIASGVSFV